MFSLFSYIPFFFLPTLLFHRLFLLGAQRPQQNLFKPGDLCGQSLVTSLVVASMVCMCPEIS